MVSCFLSGFGFRHLLPQKEIGKDTVHLLAFTLQKAEKLLLIEFI